MLWSSRKRRFSSRVSRLSEQQKLLLATACADRSVAELSGIVRASRAAKHLPLVREAMNFLWDRARGRKSNDQELTRLLKSVDRVIPGEDDPEDLIFGWPDVLNAIYYALLCAEGKDTKKWAISACEYAYLTIYQRDIVTIPKMMTEREFNKVEEECESCLAAIEFQFQTLARIEEGKRIRRKTPAK